MKGQPTYGALARPLEELWAHPHQFDVKVSHGDKGAADRSSVDIVGGVSVRLLGSKSTGVQPVTDAFLLEGTDESTPLLNQAFMTRYGDFYGAVTQPHNIPGLLTFGNNFQALIINRTRSRLRSQGLSLAAGFMLLCTKDGDYSGYFARSHALIESCQATVVENGLLPVFQSTRRRGFGFKRAQAPTSEHQAGKIVSEHLLRSWLMPLAMVEGKLIRTSAPKHTSASRASSQRRSRSRTGSRRRR